MKNLDNLISQIDESLIGVFTINNDHALTQFNEEFKIINYLSNGLIKDSPYSNLEDSPIFFSKNFEEDFFISVNKNLENLEAKIESILKIVIKNNRKQNKILLINFRTELKNELVKKTLQKYFIKNNLSLIIQ